MKPVQAYKCDYCPRCFGRAVDASNHEAACKGNPQRHMCITCKHCVVKREILSTLFGDGPAASNEVPTCVILDSPIYDQPYFDECEVEIWPMAPDRPLPGTCKNYEYKGYAKFERQALT